MTFLFALKRCRFVSIKVEFIFFDRLFVTGQVLVNFNRINGGRNPTRFQNFTFKCAVLMEIEGCFQSVFSAQQHSCNHGPSGCCECRSYSVLVDQKWSVQRAVETMASFLWDNSASTSSGHDQSSESFVAFSHLHHCHDNWGFDEIIFIL